VEATVTDDGSRSGSIVLKKMLGRGGHVPGELEQALAHGIPVEGIVTGQNKGGFDVQVVGLRAFCPASQIDLRRHDPAEYVGQRFQFRVTKIEGGGRNIVVSRRQLLEEESAKLAATVVHGSGASARSERPMRFCPVFGSGSIFTTCAATVSPLFNTSDGWRARP